MEIYYLISFKYRFYLIKIFLIFGLTKKTLYRILAQS